jgi:hypothetical protein
VSQVPRARGRRDPSSINLRSTSRSFDARQRAQHRSLDRRPVPLQLQEEGALQAEGRDHRRRARAAAVPTTTSLRLPDRVAPQESFVDGTTVDHGCLSLYRQHALRLASEDALRRAEYQVRSRDDPARVGLFKHCVNETAENFNQFPTQGAEAKPGFRDARTDWDVPGEWD